jgi:hypothetical protein
MGQDYMSLLMKALETEKARGFPYADDRATDDSPEINELQQRLEDQYDPVLEDAAMKGFGVSLAHPAGKRYILWRNKCADETDKYNKADTAKKREMIESWIRGQFEKYTDTRSR